MKVLFIGNGPSVLDHQIGHIIDDIDFVVRFNNFQINNYHKFVGTKTNLIARRSCDDILLHDPPSHGILNFITHCPLASGMRIVEKQLRVYYGERLTSVPESVCRILGEQMGLDQPVKERASIGGLCVGWFAGKWAEVKWPKLIGAEFYIHGFDGGKMNKHYFTKPPRDAHYHNGEKESKYIAALGVKNFLDSI